LTEGAYLSPDEIGKLTLYQARIYSVEQSELEGKKKMSLEEARAKGLDSSHKSRRKRIQKSARRSRAE